MQSIDFGSLHPMFPPTGLTRRFGRPPRKATGFLWSGANWAAS